VQGLLHLRFLTKQLTDKDMNRSFSGISFHSQQQERDSMAGFSKTQYCPCRTYVFRAKIISSGIWSARLPDLSPCYSFLWSCLKEEVYNSNPRREEEPKENIRREIANILAEQLQRANEILLRQCGECLHVEGQHFQYPL
jgi:hypothetical protein